MSIYQLLRYSVPSLIDGISNGYTLITIHELKPWVFFAFNVLLFQFKSFASIAVDKLPHFYKDYNHSMNDEHRVYVHSSDLPHIRNVFMLVNAGQLWFLFFLYNCHVVGLKSSGPVPQRFVTLHTHKLFTNLVEYCLRAFHIPYISILFADHYEFLSSSPTRELRNVT